MIEALQSALDQTAPCGIIVIENGSSFLDDVEGDAISVIHSEKGLSRARNAGIRKSTTEFFFPLDCNDWLPDNSIEISLKKIPSKGFLYGSTMLFEGPRGISDQHHYPAKPYVFEDLMQMVYWPNGCLQRKADWETIGGYREDLPFLEDWDYWMTAGERGVCGTAIQDTLYWYRQHSGIVRTLNKSREWNQVRILIQSFHRDIYKGVYPPMCCGNRTNRINEPWQQPSQLLQHPGQDGMILIEYVGGNAGTSTWYGPVTGTRYVAGGSLKKIYIDARDSFTGIQKKRGLLELNDHGTPVFVESTP